jgi:hypothetical protein
MKYVGAIGNVLFLCLTIRLVCAYGSEWEFGRYCMPRSLVGPDGRTYANGREIDSITLAAIKADREEESFLTVLCFIAAVAVVGVGLSYLDHRRLMALRRLGDQVKRCQREGKWKEADELLRQFESLAGIKRQENQG